MTSHRWTTIGPKTGPVKSETMQCEMTQLLYGRRKSGGDLFTLFPWNVI
jgi:hypothetical protein